MTRHATPLSIAAFLLLTTSGLGFAASSKPNFAESTGYGMATDVSSKGTTATTAGAGASSVSPSQAATANGISVASTGATLQKSP